MLRYLYGEDTYGVREELTRLAGQSPVQWVDREALDRTPLLQWIDRAAGTLFGSALVVIQDPSQLPQAHQEAIIAAVELLDKQKASIVIWDRLKWDKRSALWKALKPYAQEYAALDSARCVEWLLRYGQQRGSTLQPDAARLLVQYAGTDRWRLAGEVERLSLLAPEVTVSMIKEHVIPISGEVEVFPLLDALTSGNKKEAINQLGQLWQGGESEFYVLAMLLYQWKTLLTIRQAQTTESSPEAVARQTGLHPFVVKKNWAIARRLSITACLQALSRIMATDFAIKQGIVESRTAVTMLTLALGDECARISIRA